MDARWSQHPGPSLGDLSDLLAQKLIDQLEVDEITIPSPDFPKGHTFGPVLLVLGSTTVDSKLEVPVSFAFQRRKMFGIEWYPQICRVRGVFRVNRDRITLVLTDAPVVIERASFWRRIGSWLVTRSSRTKTRPADAQSRLFRR